MNQHNLGQLRHLYQQLVSGAVSSAASARSIGKNLLGPVIAAVEREVQAKSDAGADRAIREEQQRERLARRFATRQAAPATADFDLPAPNDSVEPDWRMPTSYVQRFTDAVTLLCNGTRPSDEMVKAWLTHTTEQLQDFAATHGPAWAQGIGLLDAAHTIADQPTEGVAHEMHDEAVKALKDLG